MTEYTDDNESANSSSSSSDSDADPSLLPALQMLQCQDEYSAQTQRWAQRIPIGLGLCPWAIRSQHLGRLKYITCEGDTPADVTKVVLSEAKSLCRPDEGSDDVAEMSTALIVCPHVLSWKEDFEIFDEFVKGIGKSHQNSEETESGGSMINNILQSVTLVSFHPKFLRWRGLPDGIEIGSAVQSYKGMVGFRKSNEIFPATVIETKTPMFGERKVKVQFNHDKREQYIPTDWIVQYGNEGTTNLNGPILPDNAMHRAPYPTIHVIRNTDLKSLCARNVSRLKRKNAKQIAKLGWEGIERKLGPAG